MEAAEPRTDLLVQERPPWWARPFLQAGAIGAVALLAIAGVVWFVKTEREDRLAERAAFVKVMETSAAAMNDIAKSVRENTAADAEWRAVWRAVYLPDIPPAPAPRRRP